MTTLNQIKIKEEILNLIRNSDIISISDRNVATTTDNFTATTGQTDFTLTNPAVTNIRKVEVDSVELDLYDDYDINIFGKTTVESKLVTLTNALTGGENVDIQYDYNKSGSLSGEKIRAEYNEDFVTINTIPRIGFELVSINNQNRSTNDTLQQKNLVFDFYIVAYSNDIDTLRETYYNLIFNNRKSLKCLNLLRPSGESSKKPMEQFKNQLVFNKFFSFTAPAEFEN